LIYFWVFWLHIIWKEFGIFKKYYNHNYILDFYKNYLLKKKLFTHPIRLIELFVCVHVLFRFARITQQPATEFTLVVTVGAMFVFEMCAQQIGWIKIRCKRKKNKCHKMFRLCFLGQQKRNFNGNLLKNN
jgi:hypothetical protein